MSQLTATVSPGLVSPLPHPEPRLALALTRLWSWVKDQHLFSSPSPASERRPAPERNSLGARPIMAAAWYGSLGPGPMCLPGQPAIAFEPGYRD
jgi:hypothetical protein